MLPEAYGTLWALSALRVAVDHGVLASLVSGPKPLDALARDARLDHAIATRILDTLAAYGVLVRDGETFALTDKGRAQAARGDALAADLAVTFGQTRALVEEARRGSLAAGWRPNNPEVIRAQARLSYGVTMRMSRPMMELWPELASALGRDGAVLVDIGVGGAGGACALCKLFPKLRVVGIDPLPAALVEARTNVEAHGLTDRIELRAQRGDDLVEKHTFDVAFVAAKFMTDASLAPTLQALAGALKPDGCILTMAWRDAGDPRITAVSKLRDELWGAGPRPTEALTAMLEAAGFRKVRIGPSPGSMVPILAARQ